MGASKGAGVEYIRSKGKEAMGLEVSLEAVNWASGCGRPVLWGSATAIPFPNNHIDLIYSTDMMEHLREEDTDLAVSEMHRVAKKYIAVKISSLPEAAGWGKKVGVEDLHLTQQPIEWWIKKFLEHGGKLDFHQGDMFIIDKTGE